ncbi:MAG: hypothetical protein ACQESR_12985 [Planctomycetota bacterium]
MFEDLTFREIRGHQIKYDFLLEKTGLETRPTYTSLQELLDVGGVTLPKSMVDRGVQVSTRENRTEQPKTH